MPGGGSGVFHDNPETRYISQGEAKALLDAARDALDYLKNPAAVIAASKMSRMVLCDDIEGALKEAIDRAEGKR